MVRIAKPSDPKRLEELKHKIQDAGYLANAIQSIAVKLTNELMQAEAEEKGSRVHLDLGES